MTHDRYFLDNVAGWILELDRGRGIPWQGNYSSWLEQKQERLRIEEKQESARMRTLERELEFIRMSPRARQAKGKARLNTYEQLLAQGPGERIGRAEIVIPNGPRLGDVPDDHRVRDPRRRDPHSGRDGRSGLRRPAAGDPRSGEDRKRRLGAEADQPHRIRYKPIRRS